jgi:hypothetical protein
VPLSADAEADVADCFRAEAFLEFSQDFGLGNLFELVVQGWLEHADIEDSVTQRYRGGVDRDEFANDLGPGVDYFSFVQALAKAQALHQFRQHIGRGLPAVRSRFFLGEAAPLGEHSGAKRGVHREFEDRES